MPHWNMTLAVTFQHVWKQLQELFTFIMHNWAVQLGFVTQNLTAHLNFHFMYTQNTHKDTAGIIAKT